MEIRIEPHTLKRATERGASKTEIISCLKSGQILPAKNGRFAKEMVFNFNSNWNGKFYEQKKIEVIYTIDNKVIVTITVYVFYSKWE
ncbi:DUF4258 domain-containing protein [bacterium]|nr:DUF4258 domain-containing protein [bacterium]